MGLSELCWSYKRKDREPGFNSAAATMFLHCEDERLTHSLPEAREAEHVRAARWGEKYMAGMTNANRLEGSADDEDLFAGTQAGRSERASLHTFPAPPSSWTRSRAKRFFDVALVLAGLPLLLPLCLLIAIAIRISSTGPVFFVQKRAGLRGRLFSIVKFRTMVHSRRPGKGFITTIEDEHITEEGRVLRYWKLDELPQFLNVLRGDMSLVGPRPRVPEQQTGRLRCRPGITGAASLAFAREEVLLAGVPRDLLDTYYASRVLPLKQRLDDDYMARATFFSDLKLICKTVVAVGTAVEGPDLSDELAGEACGMQGAVLPGESCD
jgi:lipopolysaccharide/colanic/teichoic acid biosynthesis glycosyltransferase